MAKSAECQCTSSFTCGYCCRNVKPYLFTPAPRESFAEYCERLRVGESVNILDYPVGHPNHEGRITRIEGNTVWVSNMNMPYCGTLANQKFSITSIQRKA